MHAYLMEIGNQAAYSVFGFFTAIALLTRFYFL